MKDILLCGHRSFASQGLLKLIDDKGLTYDCFTRGKVYKEGNVVTGPVEEIHENGYLDSKYDTVINYIFINKGTVEENLRYMKSLVLFCNNKKVKHLIHVSSCSVYKNNEKNVNELSPLEGNVRKKGPYGAVKSAQETYLYENLSKEIKLSILRPGLILANGMGGYIGGIGITLPWNIVLGLGNKNSQISMISRQKVNQAVIRLIDKPSTESPKVYLLAATPSPTRKQYLNMAAKTLGVGTRVYFLPVFLWKTLAFFAQCFFTIIGQGKLGIYSKINSVCRFQRFNSSNTEKELNLNFSEDWEQIMINEFDNQKKNFNSFLNKKLDKIDINKVDYIGAGRIVKQRHLPAFRKLGFNGILDAYDLFEDKSDKVLKVNNIKELKPHNSELIVIATPGPLHINSIKLLENVKGPILVEKPLAYTKEEYTKWLEFMSKRQDSIYCCHDRRFKKNVRDMLSFIEKHNPGKLFHVNINFQSSPVNKETVSWLKQERKSRTLLMDSGIHHLDIACLFAKGEPQLLNCVYELNGQGETCYIEGNAKFDNYSLGFTFRQGINQKKAKIDFIFQNYNITLGFAPDVFVPKMANENFGISLIEAKQSFKNTIIKIFDKFTGRESEDSHAYAIHNVISNTDNLLRIDKLDKTYNLIFQISEQVYGKC